MQSTFAVFNKKPAQTKKLSRGKTYGSGYMPGYATPVNWFIHHKPIEAPSPSMGNYGGPTSSITGTTAAGPYLQEFSLTPEQAFTLYLQDTSLLAQLVDITFFGLGGNRSQLAPLGTPGQYKDALTLMIGESMWEYHGVKRNADGSIFRPEMYGQGVVDHIESPISPWLLNVKPKKRKKRKANWLNPTGVDANQ